MDVERLVAAMLKAWSSKQALRAAIPVIWPGELSSALLGDLDFDGGQREVFRRTAARVVDLGLPLRPLLLRIAGDAPTLRAEVDALLRLVPDAPQADPPSGDELKVTVEGHIVSDEVVGRLRELGRAVVLVECVFPDGSRSCGTGFRIGARRLLTARHVLFREGLDPSSVTARFGAGRYGAPDAPGPLAADPRTARPSASPEVRRAALDWATIDLVDPPPVEDWPPLRVGGDGRVAVGEVCYLAHHPEAGGLSFTLTGNHVRRVDEASFEYLAHTEAGSSGAPVFDERMEVAGVHRRWVEVTDPAAAEHRRNAAVRLSAILRDPAWPGTE